MKNIGIIAALALLILLESCQPPVVFGEPQPSDVRPLSHIPKNYWGYYWCRMDSVALFVDERALIKRKEIRVKLTRTEIEGSPELELRKDALFVRDWDQSFPVEQRGDSIFSTLVVRDTLFNIGEHEVPKLWKGHLILNKEFDENAWMVSVLTLGKDGMLTMARAELPEDLAQLGEIVDVKTMSTENGQVTQIFIVPNQEQFEMIFQQGILFGDNCSEFERIIPLTILD